MKDFGQNDLMSFSFDEAFIVIKEKVEKFETFGLGYWMALEM